MVDRVRWTMLGFEDEVRWTVSMGEGELRAILIRMLKSIGDEEYADVLSKSVNPLDHNILNDVLERFTRE
jgi:hypothetical protein